MVAKPRPECNCELDRKEEKEGTAAQRKQNVWDAQEHASSAPGPGAEARSLHRWAGSCGDPSSPSGDSDFILKAVAHHMEGFL